MTTPEQEWRGIVRVTVDVPVVVYTQDDENEDDARDYMHEQAAENIGYHLNIVDTDVESIEQVSA